MSTLPRVAESTREQVSREFDDVGPDACVAEISTHLRDNNPEWLQMAAKCAADVGDEGRMMGGFCMFYRLLVAQMASSYPLKAASGVPAVLNPLPRVTARTRASIVAEIDQRGAEAFIHDAIQALDNNNPQLFQMPHFFPPNHAIY